MVTQPSGPSAQALRIETTVSAERWPALRAFLATHYRPDLALLWKPLFDWQYQARPDGGGACMLSAWSEQRLVGILGYAPVPSFWGTLTEAVPAAWAMNWMVDPSYRMGIGWLLMRKLHDMHPVLTSVDASADNVRLVEPLGWKVFTTLPRYVLVLDAASAREKFGLAGAIAEAPRIESHEALRDVRAADGTYRPNWPKYGPMRYGAVRSLAHLEWRYLRHPRFTYHVVATGAPDRPAVAVYRVELAFDAAGHDVAPVARVVEFFHPHDAQGRLDAAALLAGLAARLRRDGCVFADTWMSSGCYGATLVECGWCRERSEQPLLPSRLAPVQQLPRNLNFEIGVRRPFTMPAGDDTYITRGDSDADRPSMLAA
ncbi:MAG: GNAT family N-acetyltransferase [Acidobacteriota bacterium]